MTTGLIGGDLFAEEVLAGPWPAPIISELPVQFDLLPAGSPLPTGGAVWVAGTVVPLKRVTSHREGAALATVAIVTVANQAPFDVLHPDATTNRVEVTLDFGDASASSARTWARRYLNIAAQAREGITIELIPNVGPVPYVDFGIGDNIAVLGEQHRVAAIGMRLDAGSIVEWSVDLDQPKMLLQERLAAIMRRFLPGGASGRTILPSPTDPSFPANSTPSEEEHKWQWDGPLGDIQLYKNGTAITGAVVSGAGTNGTTDKVTVTDPARKFVKEVDKITITAGGGAHSPEWVPPKGRWIQELRATADTDVDTVVISVLVV
jgi:hypothetical protein